MLANMSMQRALQILSRPKFDKKIIQYRKEYDEYLKDRGICIVCIRDFSYADRVYMHRDEEYGDVYDNIIPMIYSGSKRNDEVFKTYCSESITNEILRKFELSKEDEEFCIFAVIYDTSMPYHCFEIMDDVRTYLNHCICHLWTFTTMVSSICMQKNNEISDMELSELPNLKCLGNLEIEDFYSFRVDAESG